MASFLQVKNRATSDLSNAVSASAVSWVVDDSTQFPTTYPFHLTCENEIVEVTNNDTGTNTLTVIRAKEGTTASTHASGKEVRLNITAEIISQLQDGSLIPRIAEDETITGKWTFEDDLTVANLLASANLDIGAYNFRALSLTADGLTPGRLVRAGTAGLLEDATVTELNGALGGITTLGMSGQLTNTLAIGTAPFVITSTTKVANLNVEMVDGIHASASATANMLLALDADKDLELGTGDVNCTDITATGSTQLGDANTDIHGINTAPVANQMVTEAFASDVDNKTIYGRRQTLTLTGDVMGEESDGGGTGLFLRVNSNLSISGDITWASFLGVYGLASINPTSVGADSQIDVKGGRFSATGNLGTIGFTQHIGLYASATGTADKNYGLYINVLNAVQNYALWGNGGHIVLDDDSKWYYAGEEQDAYWGYDGTNMIFNPKYVGTGVMLADTNSKWCFRDTEIGWNSVADGYLDGFADIGVRITSPLLAMGNDALIAVDVNSGLTASTTQTQGQGALTAQVNEISTVANDDDTVTLPSAVTGIEIEVINNGANTLQIFPASGDDLGLGVNIAEELMANERVKFVAYSTTNWAKESSTEIIHAEIHDEDNTNAFVINDAGGDFHSYHTNGLAAGDLADFAFDAGGAGTSFPIISVADSAGSPGTQILVTTTGSHGLAVGDIISQTNLADAAYVGIFEVIATASATTYEVTAAYTATGTGTMDQAATLTADAVAAGVYSFAYYVSGTSSTNNETVDFQLQNNATTVVGSKVIRKFGTASDFGSLSGGGVVSVANGDKLSLALSNEDSAGNITLKNFTLVLIRL